MIAFRTTNFRLSDISAPGVSDRSGGPSDFQNASIGLIIVSEGCRVQLTYFGLFLESKTLIWFGSIVELATVYKRVLGKFLEHVREEIIH